MARRSCVVATYQPNEGETFQVSVVAADAYPDGLVKLSLPVRHGRDHRGVPFSFVLDTDVRAIASEFLPIPGQDPYDLLKMTDWYASWGAYPNSSPGPAINGATDPTAGDVLLWMVSQSSLTWDTGRCVAAAEGLRGFKLAGAVEAETKPIDWLSDHVFGILPCLLTSGPLGLYPVVIPYRGVVGSPAATLTVDAADVVLPSGSVQVEADGEKNVVAVNWCRDGISGAFYKRAFRSGYDGGNESSATSPWYTYTLPTQDNPPRSVSYDLPYVWDDSTALLVLDWLCWREMKQRRTVSLDVDASRYGHLAVGDLVDLTADALHLDAARCLVVSVRRSASPWWRVRVMPLDE